MSRLFTGCRAPWVSYGFVRGALIHLRILRDWHAWCILINPTDLYWFSHIAGAFIYFADITYFTDVHWFHGFSWISWISWIAWIPWICIDSHGFPWISWMRFMDFDGFHGFLQISSKLSRQSGGGTTCTTFLPKTYETFGIPIHLNNNLPDFCGILEGIIGILRNP